jgi:hypothetical protein
MRKNPRKRRRLFRGQSIVEFTLLLPLLLMLLSSLIEFGFMLNEYLDLIDTSRETARYLADLDPFNQPGNAFKEDFYTEGYNEMSKTLNRAGWIHLDSSTDDLVISIFAITGNTDIARYPTEYGQMGWRKYGNKPSKFSEDDVLSRFSSGTSQSPPNNGIVLVELFYSYHMRLGLPWVTSFMGDTIDLHAYSFAPNAFAEPD